MGSPLKGFRGGPEGLGEGRWYMVHGRKSGRISGCNRRVRMRKGPGPGPGRTF